jgi:dienelactone hydrolase
MGGAGGQCSQVFHRDADADGFGSDSDTMTACSAPAGYVASGGDCNDSLPAVHPGAALQDGIDANCDGSIDFDVDGDGTSDRSPTGFSFDPFKQHHIELAQVAQGVPFSLDIHDGEVAKEGISLVAGTPFAKALSWDPAAGKLGGTIRDPGVYRFPVSVCKVFPYDPAACQDPKNLRLDLAHLTVRPTQPAAAAADPAPQGQYKAVLDKALVDITGIFSQNQSAQIPDEASFEKTPEHAAAVASIAMGTTPTRVIYPSSDGVIAASGSFPLVVLLHGNGYHWDDYDQLGSLLASQGMVVVIPQFVTGFLGACGGASTEQRVQFGVRAASWVLDQSAKAGSFLEGRVDPARLVLVGHSWGGAAAEWGIPLVGARAAVIFDPISLLDNISEWTGCTKDVLGGNATKNHLRPALRDVSLPVLLLDSGASPFTRTLTEYRGLYPSSPVMHVSTQGTLHEDFLDPAEAHRWIDVGTCYDDARLAAHKAAVSVWITRLVGRYVNDDPSFDALVHGPGSLRMTPGVFPSGVFVSSFRPVADGRLLDRGAAFPFGSSHDAPRPNLAGGTTVLDGGTATIDLTPSASAALAALPDGVFKQSEIDYLTSDEHPGYRKLSVQQDGAVVTLRESFSSPLDASGFRVLAADLAIGQPLVWYNCSKSLPDTAAEPLNAVIRLTSADGKIAALSGAAISGTNTTYNDLPASLMADLSSLAGQLDLSKIVLIEIVVPAGSQPRQVAFDDLRLIP